MTHKLFPYGWVGLHIGSFNTPTAFIIAISGCESATRGCQDAGGEGLFFGIKGYSVSWVLLMRSGVHKRSWWKNLGELVSSEKSIGLYNKIILILFFASQNVILWASYFFRIWFYSWLVGGSVFVVGCIPLHCEEKMIPVAIQSF